MGLPTHKPDLVRDGKGASLRRTHRHGNAPKAVVAEPLSRTVPRMPHVSRASGARPEAPTWRTHPMQTPTFCGDVPYGLLEMHLRTLQTRDPVRRVFRDHLVALHELEMKMPGRCKAWWKRPTIPDTFPDNPSNHAHDQWFRRTPRGAYVTLPEHVLKVVRVRGWLRTRG